VNLPVEGADAAGVAALEEGFALRDRPTVVVAKVDLVATLPVVTTLAFFAEVLRLRARVLRRHEADYAFRAAADLSRVTFAVPVATVLERLAVLIPSPLVQAGPVDQPEVAFPPVATSGGGDDGGAVPSADKLGIGAHRGGHDARLRTKGDAVHHAALGADARSVTPLIHLITHFIPLAFEGAKHFVTLPDGAALARLLHLASVAAVDRLDRRRAHRIALEEAVFADAPLDAAVLPHFAVLIHFPVVDARQRTGFVGSGEFVTPRVAESAAISVVVDADFPASGGSDLTRPSVLIDSRFAAAGRSRYARPAVDGNSRLAAARRAQDTRFAGVIDADAGPRSRSAARRTQDARSAGVLVDAGRVTSGRSHDAGLSVVVDADFSAAGRSYYAELAFVVDAGAIASGRADDADFSVVGYADFPADAVLIVGVDAALPLGATIGWIVTRQRRQLGRFVAAAGRRRARVLASRALGQIRAVTSLWEFSRLHEKPRRRLLGKARGVLRAGRALRRAHRPLIGDEPAGHRQQTASLVLSLKAGDAAVVRRLVAAAAAAAPSAGVIVIARLGHRPSHLRREEKEEEEEDDAAEGGEESGSGSTRHQRRHCFFFSSAAFLFIFLFQYSLACLPHLAFTSDSF